MHTLVLGGTAWLGHQVARAALLRGHEVTCLARCVSGTVPDGVRLVRGDRASESGLAPVRGRGYDLVVDLTRHPGQARRAVRDLGEDVGHWVFVSSGSVYADHSVSGVGPDAPVLEALDAEVMADMSVYGRAKVACERAYTGLGAGRVLVARAGLIGGPGDASSRSGYWPWRFRYPRGGRVLVPDEPEQGIQLVDVRDLASWLVDAGERRLSGVVDAVGSPLTLGELLRTCRFVAGSSVEPLPVSSEWLVEQGVTPWMGPRSLPLWLGGDPDWQGFGARSDASAREAGLRLRPLADTLRDALAWEERRVGDHGWPAESGAGLTDEDEAALLSSS